MKQPATERENDRTNDKLMEQTTDGSNDRQTTNDRQNK